MTLTIDVPKSVEDRLIEKARDAGMEVSTYLAHVVQAHASRPTLRELSGEVYDQFVASGMTDDELGDFLEKAKHEMRAERDARQHNGQ